MKRLLFGLLLAATATQALAQFGFGGAADKLLEPEKAFRLSARPADGAVEVRHVLRHREVRSRRRVLPPHGRRRVRLSPAARFPAAPYFVSSTDCRGASVVIGMLMPIESSTLRIWATVSAPGGGLTRW